MEPLIFDVEDYTGTLVVLTRRVWENKILSGTEIGHPEVAPYLDEVRQAVAAPDIVFESTRRDDSRLSYRLGVGKGRYEGLHIVVVVKYRMEPEGQRGYVSTVYLARRLYAQGRVLWARVGLVIS